MFKHIDAYLNAKSSSDRRILNMLAFIIGAFLAYILFFEHSFVFLNEKASEKSLNIQKLEQLKFSNYESLTQTNKDKILRTYQNELNANKEKLGLIKAESKILQTSLNEVLKSLPDTQNWAKFLDEIAIIAKQNNIEIQGIKNTHIAPSSEHIGQFLGISIKANAQFKSILTFLSQIEHKIPFIEVKKLLIENGGNLLKVQLEIVIWGLKR